MAVGVLEVEGDRGHRLRGTAADLREVELDPIREVDADTMLSACRRAPDRTGRGLEHAGNHDARFSALDIHVKLDVLNEVTSFKSFSVNGTSFENPVVATKSLTTVARARTGETVVLGGLIDTVARNSREGLPVLSHVPILGVLFRNEDRNESSRELVIVITPTIRDAGPGS